MRQMPIYYNIECFWKTLRYFIVSKFIDNVSIENQKVDIIKRFVTKIASFFLYSFTWNRQFFLFKLVDNETFDEIVCGGFVTFCCLSYQKTDMLMRWSEFFSLYLLQSKCLKTKIMKAREGKMNILKSKQNETKQNLK